MNLLYFGTVCNREAFEQRQSKSRQKASTAPLNFESALLEGFAAHGTQVEVFSFPMVASFPNSPLFSWGAKKETVAGGYGCTWLPALNLKGLKQLSQRLSVRRALRRIKKGQVDAVLLYSVYAPVAAPVLKTCKKQQIPCYCIIADLPRDMYENRKMGKCKKLLSKAYTNRAVKLQGSFDGYIYLTEAMAAVVAPGTRYVVVEGIADSMLLDFPQASERKKAVMYAGALNEKYGIRTLTDAFLSLELPDWELWIFGQGDLSDYFTQIAEKEPRLRFFGRVDRAEVLRREAEASVLVNPRPTGEAYTKYSFPSKTIEYMLSGTPLLMACLPGVPGVYFPHLFSAGSGTPEELKHALREVTSQAEGKLTEKGLAARNFVLSRASAPEQARRILAFMKKQ